MNLQKLSDHTVDVDLLPETGWALDIGCRGFGWSRDILRLRHGMMVLAFDPDPAIEFDHQAMENFGIAFARAAVTTHTGRDWFSPGGEAGHIRRPEERFQGMPVVECVHIGDLTSRGVTPMGTGARRSPIWPWLPDRYAVVKLDCEGSEFGILENWPRRMADQISVEFHDFLNRARWNDQYFADLFAGPLKDYRVVQHELTPVGPGNTMGHWDSLLVLRDL